ncbi:SPOR domain-containing protein [Streptomyces sp. NPDC058694]|uniref:SPOR domain-containing protein n=1 Tax=Streptomyces sp. NPDC058694 TaxID=3346603 RepID=UPI003667F92F
MMVSSVEGLVWDQPPRGQRPGYTVQLASVGNIAQLRRVVKKLRETGDAGGEPSHLASRSWSKHASRKTSIPSRPWSR